MVRARELVRRLGVLGKTAAAAESCTGGLASDAITRVPGASRVFWGSFVSYTPDAKIRMLGVREAALERYGAVSRETACAMALGALDHSGADYSFSVTGIAGPLGDGSGTPVGTVWIATAARGGDVNAVKYNFRGSRTGIRRKAAGKAVEELLKRLPGN